MDRATVLMKPLGDLWYPGYSLSICGNLWSEHEGDWMTPKRPDAGSRVDSPSGTIWVRIANPALPQRDPVKTLRLVETRPDGRKERRDVGVAWLMARAAFNPLGMVPAAGFAVRYHDGDKGNCALWNLSYGPKPGAPNARMARDGRRIFKEIWRDGELRTRMGFSWRAVAVPPTDNR